MTKRESQFQASLIKELKEMFPGCIVMKNDAGYIQGIPDILLLWEDRWAALEVKRSEDSHVQPNQKWYIDTMHEMSFAAFIWPENKEVVLDEIYKAFRN